METEMPDTKGAKKDLENFIKKIGKGKLKISFFVSTRGNQRIEIKEKGKLIESLEATSKVEDNENYDDISFAMLFGLSQ